MRTRARPRPPLVTAYLVLGLIVSLTVRSAAQVPDDIFRSPTPAPSATARPSPSPSPSPQPSPLPKPETPVPPQVGPTPTPAPSVAPGVAPPATAGPRPVSVVPGIPAGFQVPIIPRTAGRNTVKLVHILERAQEIGMPLQQALILGMGRFPVAGVAFYSDDWMNPRFTPVFHLHEGVDIFAEFGTPVRSPDRGVVTRLADGPVGGIAAWVRGRDGTQYYFAHLQGYANGIQEGTAVEAGTVVGFVGDSGNAKGGAPHLHFEVHPGGGAAVPPKPYVDAWLAEAEKLAPAWVDAQIRTVLGERALMRSEHALAGLLATDTMKPAGTPEYSVLLTLLDPVSGSVGLLPDLPLLPRRAEEGQSRLVDQLIALRVDGSLLTSFVTGLGAHTDAG